MKFLDYVQKHVHDASSEGKEKHVPFIKVADCSSCGELSVVVRVGENVFHPSTKEHYIQYIEVFGVKEDGSIVLVTKFILSGENAVPYVKTHMKKGVFKGVLVLSQCNIHGLWENYQDLADSV